MRLSSSSTSNITLTSSRLRSLCISGRLLEAVRLLFTPAIASLVDSSSYSLILQESINRREWNLCRLIHSHIITTAFPLDPYLANKLLISYSKTGRLAPAHHLFDTIPHQHTLVSWNAIISGYARHGLQRHAIHLFFHSMRSSGIRPDHFTFASLFRACAGAAALDHGRRAHCLLIQTITTTATANNVVVNTALLDMYFKCSCPDDGRRVFDSSSHRNVVTWTALISGYAQHGSVEEVLNIFQQMTNQGLRPNHITFLALISACSRGGLVDTGWNHFISMTRDYGIPPRGEHYAAVVDMLGRAGRLNEAYQFAASSPCADAHSVIWGALIGACRIHGDVGMVKRAGKKFFDMDTANIGKFVVLSNTYAASEMWEEAADIRGKIGMSGMKKEPAWSSVEVRGEVHTFLVGDKSHEQSDGICQMINMLAYALAESSSALLG